MLPCLKKGVIELMILRRGAYSELFGQVLNAIANIFTEEDREILYMHIGESDVEIVAKTMVMQLDTKG